MRYYYIFPFKKQYFFPQNYRSHPFLLSFYTPYSLSGSAIWWLWRKLPFLKRLFSVNESQVPTLTSLRNCISNKAILAINRGTTGPDQKTTAIGYLPGIDQRFFVKYAESERAKALVMNEYSILHKLQMLQQIPRIINYSKNPSGILLQTSYIEGNKVQKSTLTDEVFKLLLTLANISPDDCTDNACSFEGKKCFAHGDFCPWNMLVSDNHLQLIDWEMAGVYSAGYDMFTYLFQTSFLLHPKISILQIVKENIKYIDSYFTILKVPDWKVYLKGFADIKLAFEEKKQNPRLIPHFKRLLEYAIKA